MSEVVSKEENMKLAKLARAFSQETGTPLQRAIAGLYLKNENQECTFNELQEKTKGYEGSLIAAVFYLDRNLGILQKRLPIPEGGVEAGSRIVFKYNLGNDLFEVLKKYQADFKFN